MPAGTSSSCSEPCSLLCGTAEPTQNTATAVEMGDDPTNSRKGGLFGPGMGPSEKDTDMSANYFYKPDPTVGATGNKERFEEAMHNYLALIEDPYETAEKFLAHRAEQGLTETQQVLETVPFTGEATEFCAISDRNCYNRLRETGTPAGPAFVRKMARERADDPEWARKQRQGQLKDKLSSIGTGSGEGTEDGVGEQPSMISNITEDPTVDAAEDNATFTSVGSRQRGDGIRTSGRRGLYKGKTTTGMVNGRAVTKKFKWNGKLEAFPHAGGTPAKHVGGPATIRNAKLEESHTPGASGGRSAFGTATARPGKGSGQGQVEHPPGTTIGDFIRRRRARSVHNYYTENVDANLRAGGKRKHGGAKHALAAVEARRVARENAGLDLENGGASNPAMSVDKSVERLASDNDPTSDKDTPSKQPVVGPVEMKGPKGGRLEPLESPQKLAPLGTPNTKISSRFSMSAFGRSPAQQDSSFQEPKLPPGGSNSPSQQAPGEPLNAATGQADTPNNRDKKKSRVGPDDPAGGAEVAPSPGGRKKRSSGKKRRQRDDETVFSDVSQLTGDEESLVSSATSNPGGTKSEDDDPRARRARERSAARQRPDGDDSHQNTAENTESSNASTESTANASGKTQSLLQRFQQFVMSHTKKRGRTKSNKYAVAVAANPAVLSATNSSTLNNLKRSDVATKVWRPVRKVLVQLKILKPKGRHKQRPIFGGFGKGKSPYQKKDPVERALDGLEHGISVIYNALLLAQGTVQAVAIDGAKKIEFDKQYTANDVLEAAADGDPSRLLQALDDPKTSVNLNRARDSKGRTALFAAFEMMLTHETKCEDESKRLGKGLSSPSRLANAGASMRASGLGNALDAAREARKKVEEARGRAKVGLLGTDSIKGGTDHLSAHQKTQSFEKVLGLLLARGARIDIKQDPNKTENSGWGLTHVAASFGSVSRLAWLCSKVRVHVYCALALWEE